MTGAPQRMEVPIQRLVKSVKGFPPILGDFRPKRSVSWSLFHPPCPSLMLIAWFWQLLTDQTPSAGKKHPMPGIWSPYKLTLHLLSLLLVLLLPASSPPALSAFCILRKPVGSEVTQNVASGTFCPYLCTVRLQESKEIRNQARKAIWLRGLSFVLWRCILFFTCLFCSFPDPFLEACHTRCSLLLAAW